MTRSDRHDRCKNQVPDAYDSHFNDLNFSFCGPGAALAPETFSYATFLTALCSIIYNAVNAVIYMHDRPTYISFISGNKAHKNREKHRQRKQNTLCK